MKARQPLTVVLLTGMVLLAFLSPAHTLSRAAQTQSTAQPGTIAAGGSHRAPAVVQSSQLMFIENAGQYAEGARFHLAGGNAELFLTDDALWVTFLEQVKPEIEEHDLALRADHVAPLPVTTRGVNLKLQFVGANPHSRLESFNRLDTRVSYLLGNDPSKWRINVPVWGGVRYKDLYPNIDLELLGQQGRLVQRLVARPGADLQAVRVQVDGAETLGVADGAMQLGTAFGTFSLPLFEVTAANPGTLTGLAAKPATHGNQIAMPFAAEQRAGAESPTETASVSKSSDLIYAITFGGRAFDRGNSVAVDQQGAAYITGGTYSSDFSTTSGTFDPSFNGGSRDAYIVKISPSGSLDYATYVGGDDDDRGVGIAVDSSGAATIVGATSSPDFPVSDGASDRTCGTDGECNDFSDAYVFKLNPSGSGRVYATFVGGSDKDEGLDIALDASGAATIVGTTFSPNFPTTEGAIDRSCGTDGNCNGSTDAFMVKLNATGSGRTYATFLGGADQDEGIGVEVDAAGLTYIAGTTFSSDFPITPSSFDRSYNGSGDIFVAKLSTTETVPIYATYLGGSGSDFSGLGIAVDASGAAAVTGATFSTNFPVTSGAFDESYNGNSDVVVAKLNPEGSGLIYSTYLGSSQREEGDDIAMNPSGAVYVTGDTYSAGFPTTTDAFDTSFGGGDCSGSPCADAFLVQMNPRGSAPAYATFLGLKERDQGGGVAVDSSGNAYVTGVSDSAGFPTSSKPAPNSDAFAIKLATQVEAPPSVQFSAASYNISESGGSATITVNLSKPWGQQVQVTYATSGGTASPGSDYQATSGTLTFNPGQTSATFTVPIVNDALLDPDETIVLTLSEPINATLGSPTSAVLTILDDEAPPTVQFSATSYTVNEHETGTMVIVILSRAMPQPVTVAYTTNDGTASAGADYSPASGVLTFAAGETGKVFSIQITNDAQDEPDETVTLTLRDATNATLGNPSNATLTIVDDDEPPPVLSPPTVQFSLQEYSDREGANIVVAATLSFTSEKEITVAYATADGTATAGVDYVSASGTLTFGPGQTSATFSILTASDTVVEPSETVLIALSNPNNATLGEPTNVTLTIIDSSSSSPTLVKLYMPLALLPLPQLPSCNDVEDNDMPAQAKPLSPLGEACKGSMEDDPQGEDDWYSFELAAGQTITIDMTELPEGADYDLIIYDETGQSIVDSSRNLNQADEHIDFQSATTARYLLRINMYRKATVTTNTYTLKAVISS